MGLEKEEVAKISWKPENEVKPTGLTGDPEIDSFLLDCFKTMEVKGKDYTLGNNDIDRLYNFRKVGGFIGLDMAKVWSVYFSKHIFAILNFVKTDGQSESEPIEERIKDAVVYLLLFLKITREMKNEETSNLRSDRSEDK